MFLTILKQVLDCLSFVGKRFGDAVSIEEKKRLPSGPPRAMIILVWFICLAITLFIVASTSAHNPRYVAQAIFWGSITVDGDPGDWPQDIVQYPLGDYYWEGADIPGNTADLTAHFSVAYNLATSELYVLIRVTDQSAVIDASAWNSGDAIELFTDPDHSGGEYNSPDGGQDWSLIRDTSNLRVFDPDNPNAYSSGFTEVSKEGILARGASTSIGDTTCYEFAVTLYDGHPKEGNIPKMTRGMTVGFDMAVCDKDMDGSFTWAAWSPEGGKFRDADRMGDVVLCGPVVDVSVDPVYGRPEDVFSFRVEVSNALGLWSLEAKVAGRDGEITAMVDGVKEGTSSYRGTWKSDAIEREYDVTVILSDEVGEVTYERAVWFSTVNYPPEVRRAWVFPQVVRPGEQVTLSAEVRDADHVSSVIAQTETSDEMMATLELFDDGVHNDGLGGDGIYANTWTTDRVASFLVDILAVDTKGRASQVDHATRFWGYHDTSLRHTLRAAVARVNITPPVGAPHYFGEYRMNAGIHDSLYAKVLVLADGHETLTIVSLDLVGFDPTGVRQLLPPEIHNTMFCASHTHEGASVLEFAPPPNLYRTPYLTSEKGMSNPLELGEPF